MAQVYRSFIETMPDTSDAMVRATSSISLALRNPDISDLATNKVPYTYNRNQGYRIADTLRFRSSLTLTHGLRRELPGSKGQRANNDPVLLWNADDSLPSLTGLNLIGQLALVHLQQYPNRYETKLHCLLAGLKGAPTYAYIYPWRAPALDNANLCDHYSGGAADAFALSTKMSGSRVNFARSRNPTNNGLPYWPAYTTEKHATMDFYTNSKVSNDPEGKGLRLIARS
jgi:hypothetical protein